MAKQLTPWFPASVKPARRGVYQIRFYEHSAEDERHPEYHYWDGHRWWYGANTPKRTFSEFSDAPIWEVQPTPKPWRGLASDPKRGA